MTPLKVALRVVLVFVILAFGGAGVGILMKLRPTADKVAPAPLSTTVDVMIAEWVTRPVNISVTGVVEPARQVALSAEVSGRVVWLADDLVPGGRVRAGQTLLKVDARDYSLGVEQQESNVERAKLTLELELSQQNVAEKEWKLLGNQSVKASPLAMRVPQVKNAEVAVRSAESGLERSKLALERTAVRAPFNAMVVSEQVEVGQVAGPGAPFATLIGTDRFWITAQVPVEKLVYLQLAGGGQSGSKVVVSQDLGAERRIVKKGEALRLKSMLDAATRTASIVIGVDAPLSSDTIVPGATPLPLLPGAFVNLEIEGRSVEKVIALPRKSLVEGDQVWTVDDEGRLRAKTVAIAWRADEDVYVTDGLPPGTKVVTSPLALPVEGMKVDLSQVTGSKAAGAAESAPPSLPQPAPVQGG